MNGLREAMGRGGELLQGEEEAADDGSVRLLACEAGGGLDDGQEQSSAGTSGVSCRASQRAKLAGVLVAFVAVLGIVAIATWPRARKQGAGMAEGIESLVAVDDDEPAAKCELSEGGPVFAAGMLGVPCFRIPSITRTTQGTLLAFSEARDGVANPGYDLAHCEDSSAHRLALRRSTDGGGTWEPLVFAVDTPKDTVENPYPVALKSGAVIVVFSSCPDPGCNNDLHKVLVVRSTDDGRTWGEPEDVTDDFKEAVGSLPGPGNGIQIETGRVIITTHTLIGPSFSHVFFTDDEGKTWTKAKSDFANMDEATIAEVGGGEFLISMRHGKEADLGRGIARSTDWGETWGPVGFDNKLIGPVCEGNLVNIRGKLYFSNPASRGRDNMLIRHSEDKGHTWSGKLIFHKENSWGYSSIVQGTTLDEDHSGVLFESSPQGKTSNIDYCNFPLDF